MSKTLPHAPHAVPAVSESGNMLLKARAIDDIVTAVLVTDGDGRIAYANGAFYRLLGHSGDVCGRLLGDICPELIGALDDGSRELLVLDHGQQPVWVATTTGHAPGDSGQRNGLRGDGFFTIDLGLAKRFTLFTHRDVPHTLQFRAEAFNVTNTVRFDVATSNTDINDPGSFGKYTSQFGSPRVFQFALRYEF